MIEEIRLDHSNTIRTIPVAPYLDTALFRDIVPLVFSKLSLFDLNNCRQVCTVWRAIIKNDFKFETIWKNAFGKNLWEKYFGEIPEEPPLPIGIGKFLITYEPGTYTLLLIPKSVNGTPLTADSLGELVISPKKGNSTGFFHRKITYGTTSVEESCWVLILNNILQGTEKKTFDDQLTLVDKLSNEVGVKFRVTKMLDVITLIFTTYVSSGKRLFSDKPETNTRCEETNINGGHYTVGDYGEKGLRINTSYFNSQNKGVTVSCRF